MISENQSFLLDTCTLLWIAKSPDLLPKPLELTLRTAESHLYMSAASIWELGLKRGAGFDLTGSLDTFATSLQETYAIELLPIEPIACEQLWKLPPIHRDPFDRMLVAQAIAHGMVLVTPDSEIAKYPVRVVWN